MAFLEQLLIEFLLLFVSPATLRDWLGNPQIVSIIIGAFVAASGGLLGTWLVLRKMSLTAGAISRTVLLGIVGMFIILTRILDQKGDLESPLLIVGAAIAGLLTVYLAELVFRSGLVREDAALGLIYPLLFAMSIVIIARYVDDVHLDEDTVMLGELGIAWLDFNEHCLENCDPITITPDHPAAKMGQVCVNCRPEGEFLPYDDGAQFEPVCVNCGELPASIAYNRGFSTTRPEIIFFPKSITTTGFIALLNLLFVGAFFKELKLSTFDPALATSLGLRPGLWMYALMLLVSITTVTAFSAVGAVLIVAFFIVPPATAYLLTDRASRMVMLSILFGVLAVVAGYSLSQGKFLGVFEIETLLKAIDRSLIDLKGHTTWNTNVAGSIVTMAGFFFVVVWVISPRYGVLSTWLRRYRQSQQFAEQTLLMYLEHHQRVNLADLPRHLQWTPTQTQRVIQRAHARQRVEIHQETLQLTEAGHQQVRQFSLR